MRSVIQHLRSFFAVAPAVLPEGRIGLQFPSTAAELPALVLTLAVTDPEPSRFGRFLREGVTMDSFRGKLTMDLCGTTFPQVDSLHATVEERVRKGRESLRQAGFNQLDPCSVEPAVAILQNTPFGSAFAVWKLRLGYRFAFEAEQTEETGEGKIGRIDVDLQGAVIEKFSLPGN